jgi:glycerol-3-phosphate dehydrogenase
LVHDPNAKHTESLVRNHLVTVSESGLLTCAGGKWTTYREMSEDAVNKAVEVFGLKPRNDKLLPNISGFGQEEGRRANGSCQTRSLQLVGAHGFSDALPLDLMKHYGMDEDVARYLARSYGDRAWEVARLSSESEPSARRKRIVPSYPYLDAEVRYAVRNEYALTSADFLARRTRLAFLDSQAALEALPHVIELMGEELRWSKAKKDAEWKQTIRFLASMGLPESMLGVTKEQVVSGRASAELRTGKRKSTACILLDDAAVVDLGGERAC